MMQVAGPVLELKESLKQILMENEKDADVVARVLENTTILPVFPRLYLSLCLNFNKKTRKILKKQGLTIPAVCHKLNLFYTQTFVDA